MGWSFKVGNAVLGCRGLQTPHSDSSFVLQPPSLEFLCRGRETKAVVSKTSSKTSSSWHEGARRLQPTSSTVTAKINKIRPRYQGSPASDSICGCGDLHLSNISSVEISTMQQLQKNTARSHRQRFEIYSLRAKCLH